MTCFDDKNAQFDDYMRLEEYIRYKPSYYLSEQQKAELGAIIANGKLGDNYSKAYEYLKSTIPHSIEGGMGLNMWLDVAISTNSGGKAGGM